MRSMRHSSVATSASLPAHRVPAHVSYRRITPPLVWEGSWARTALRMRVLTDSMTLIVHTTPLFRRRNGGKVRSRPRRSHNFTTAGVLHVLPHASPNSTNVSVTASCPNPWRAHRGTNLRGGRAEETFDGGLQDGLCRRRGHRLPARKKFHLVEPAFSVGHRATEQTALGQVLGPVSTQEANGPHDHRPQAAAVAMLEMHQGAVNP
jgi:hypothetical protein